MQGFTQSSTSVPFRSFDTDLIVCFSFFLVPLTPSLIVLHVSSSFYFPTDSTQPFGFLKKLEGCRKEENVKVLNEAKQYLKSYGYLNVESVHENDDEYDDALESAIKTYQLNYNLETNGILDTATVKQMMMPRCGVPEIAKDEKTPMNSGMKRHQHDQGKPFSLEPKMDNMELIYRFRSSATANVNSATLQSACVRALSSWADVSNFRFRVPTSIGEINDILMGFHRLSHGDGNPFDSHLGVLGHCFGPEDGEAHLDADENWICLHELGHVLRLGHSSDTNSIMYSGIGGGQKKRTPTFRLAAERDANSCIL
ncbi:hypothetical protein MKX01_019220 [Papaver californicum]|nr:hypothetical protein MKX01_019220 [Papaver californicum]